MVAGGRQRRPAGCPGQQHHYRRHRLQSIQRHQPARREPGVLGTGGTVGVDSLTLPTLGRPEFEIVDSNNKNIGLDIQANNATVRRLSIYGFGDAQNNDGEANIRVGAVIGTMIEESVIGAAADSFTNSGSPDTGDNIRVVGGDNGTIRNNLIGFSGGNGIGV